MEDKGDLYTYDGIKPSISDLDNLFDDDDDNDAVRSLKHEVANSISIQTLTQFQAAHAPTPPDSNKPANSHEDMEDGKVKGKAGNSNSVKQQHHDPIGNASHDQLAQMFPTPPSIDSITSPAAVGETMMVDSHYGGRHGGPPSVKADPAGGIGANLSHAVGLTDLMDWSSFDDASIWRATSVFSALPRLYSDEHSPLTLAPDLLYKYKPKPRSRQRIRLVFLGKTTYMDLTIRLLMCPKNIYITGCEFQRCLSSFPAIFPPPLPTLPPTR